MHAVCMLLATHNTTELSFGIVGRAGHSIAVSFNVPEMSSVNVILAPRNRLHSDVNTFIHGTSVVHMLRYEVA
jgi:hypothetical protein